MKYTLFKLARSLCIAFLMFAILCQPLSLLATENAETTTSESITETTTTAESTAPPEPPAVETPVNYVYNVEIEFGSLGFYYDYGTWNVNTFQYETSPTSESPAADTKNDTPGFYGFDGRANRVIVKNHSTNQNIHVRLDFAADANIFASNALLMDFYEYQTTSASYAKIWESPAFKSDTVGTGTLVKMNTVGNRYEFKVEQSGTEHEYIQRDIYLSLYTEDNQSPQTTGNAPFMSSQATAIGTLTLTVATTSDFDASEGESKAPENEGGESQVSETEITTTQVTAPETTTTQAPAPETTTTQAPAPETTTTQAPAPETTTSQETTAETTAPLPETQMPETEETSS